MSGSNPQKAPRTKRQRSLTESLLSIVLGLEAVLVFFIALTVFGLLVVLLLIGTRVVRNSWGVWYGWALQVVLVLTGIVLPALYIAAGFFLAMWIFCFIRGRQIDKQNHFSDNNPRTKDA